MKDHWIDYYKKQIEEVDATLRLLSQLSDKLPIEEYIKVRQDLLDQLGKYLNDED